MVEYTGEYWQKDILERDLLNAQCLISNIASRLYPDEYSSTKRTEKLLEIPEMVRLNKLCQKECASIRKIMNIKDYINAELHSE